MKELDLSIDFDIMRQKGFYELFLKERAADIRKIRKAGGWKITEICPVCKTGLHGHSEHFLSTEFGSYVLCKECHCIYLNKIPKKQNTGQYTLKDLQSVKKIPDEKKRLYRMGRFGEERIQIIDKHLEKPLSKASLLDVGCNTGFFLEVAKNYFNKISGVDVSPVLAKYTSMKIGCRVYTDMNDMNEKFDVITMFDTLEHVEDPLDLLRRCRDLLKPNGIIVVFTPNYESLGFRWLGCMCNHVSPGHLSMFCEDTVLFIKKKLKMKLVSYETRGMDTHDILAYRRDIENYDYTHLKKYFDLYQKVHDLMGDSNSMRFILKKETQ